MTNEITVVNEATGEILDPTTQKLVFGTQDPEGIISKATAIANRLTQIIDQAKLYKDIQGRKHVFAEGWTTMAAMLGVFPATEYCRRIDREGEVVYEAKVVLKHISGFEVGAGEALCSSRERNWSGRDEYAIKSMAQTRAVGKACRLSFSWIMALAGYAATPFEEIPDHGPAFTPIQQPKPIIFKAKEIVPEAKEVETVQKVFGGKITEKQRKLLWARWHDAGYDEAGLKAHLKQQYHLDSTGDLHYTQLQEILAKLDKLEAPDA